MNRVNEILKYVAAEMRKSANPYMKWTEREMAFMDLARWGECLLTVRKGEKGLADEKDFGTIFQPLGHKAVVNRFSIKGGGECLRFALEEETRMALMARFQEWERRNASALAPFPYPTRVEWYRIELIQSFA